MTSEASLPEAFLRIRLCRWKIVGFKLPTGRISTLWRFYHCTVCSITRKAKAQPACPLDAGRSALTQPQEADDGR